MGANFQSGHSVVLWSVQFLSLLHFTATICALGLILSSYPHKASANGRFPFNLHCILGSFEIVYVTLSHECQMHVYYVRLKGAKGMHLKAL